jgi:putative redox protein
MKHSPALLPAPWSDTLCQGTFVVANLRGPGFLTNVQVGHHEFWADGVPEEGGQNLGPAPYELLLAALATCTTMTVHRYARHQHWALHRIGVHLVHHGLAAATTSLQHAAEWIEVQLELTGELTLQQRRRLRLVAAACSVAQLLQPGISIKTVLS